MVYEQCPFRFKLSKIDKLPEPPRDEKSPLERGNRIHKHLEDHVMEGRSLDGIEALAVDKFKPLLTCLQSLYADGKVSVEENWLFDKDWNICERNEVWLWSKLDVNVRDEERATSVVIDHKSGKSTYKAIEHTCQMQLYGAETALRQEWAETIIVELWYVDEGHVKQQAYSRDQALRYVQSFDRRANRIYDDRHFRPNPNKVTCRWCPYSPRGTGACPVGV
jgi:CRISPR/Cas system-associated exonuclease Cas4 (RecB family)